jgi:hypothetical protein
MSTDVSTILIGPAIRVALARSESGATELVASGDIGYRVFNASSSQGMPAPDLGNIVSGHIGPGVRYWLADGFAISATASLHVDRFSPGGGGSSTYLVALGTALELLGVF